MRRRQFFCAILVSAIAAVARLAVANPTLYPDGSQRYAIESPTIPAVSIQAGDLCDVELQAGERINQAIISDSLRWKMTDGISGVDTPHVFVKPTESHLRALLTITTSRRTYHLRLASVDGSAQEFIAFYYLPTADELRERRARARAAVAAAVPTPEPSTPPAFTCAPPLNSQYRVDGSAWFRPASVCNDGHHTYVNMGPIDGNLPVLVIVGDGHQDQIGNVTFDAVHSEYILDGVPARLALLRDGNRGQERVSIVRMSP